MLDNKALIDALYDYGDITVDIEENVGGGTYNIRTVTPNNYVRNVKFDSNEKVREYLTDLLHIVLPPFIQGHKEQLRDAEVLLRKLSAE